MSEAPKSEDYYKLKGMIAELPEEFKQRVSAREAEIRNALALDREATHNWQWC